MDELCKLIKSKKPECEEISQDCFGKIVPTDKEARFRTQEPLRWYNAIKEHIMISKVKDITRFDMKKRKTGKVSIIEVHTIFANSELIIKINFETGVFNVKGTQAGTWVHEEFKKINEVFITDVTPGLANEDKEKERESIDDTAAEGDLVLKESLVKADDKLETKRKRGKSEPDVNEDRKDVS